MSTQTMERQRRLTRAPSGGPFAWLRGLVTRPKVGLVMIGLVLLGVMIAVVAGQLGRVREEAASAGKSAQLDTLTGPLAALCANDPVVRARLGDDVCFTAQQVVAMPPASPPAGSDGAKGTAGRGVVATVIRADGHLTVTFSDGAVVDAGPIVGRAGVNGRGIATSQILGGALILTFSDGSTENLGPVVGERGAAGIAGTAGVDGPVGTPGRGIRSTTITGGRLIITYSDQTTDDAGEVPPGPPGPAGHDAHLPASYTRTFADGTSETCKRANEDDTAPVWSCTERQR